MQGRSLHRSALYRLALCLLCLCGMPRSGQSETPRAFLHFDFENETFQGVADVSENGYHGAFITTAERAPRVVHTEYGKALEFSKRAKGGIVVANARVPAAAHGLTVMAWIHPQSTRSRQTLLSSRSEGPKGIRGFDISVNWGKLRAEIGVGAKSAVALQTPSHSIERNVWSHVAMTFNGNEIVLFINATPSARRSLASGERLRDASTQLSIGSWKKKGRFVFAGRLDDIKIFTGALTESQIVIEAARLLDGSRR